MNTNEKPDFAELLTGIAGVNNKIFSKSMVDVYWRSLKSYSWADVQRAFQAHIDNPDGGEFMPKPADIRRLLEGSGQDRALSAWTKIEKAITDIGSYESVVFDDALIHAVLEDMGGWISLCNTTTAQLKFSSIEFQKRYQGFLNFPPKRHPKVLKGRIEAQNAQSGYAVPSPKLIGDEGLARLVMSTGGGRALTVHDLDHPQHAANPVTKYLPQMVAS